MAIFEQQPARKVLLDDTEAITCVIENWRKVNGHTEFVIRVQRGPLPEKSWRIYRRYNDFLKLHTQLQVSGIPLPLPPKKIIGNMDPDFIAERQKQLQKYLNIIVMNPILVSSLPARSFVDPANYCQPFSELALQHVSLALRGEVGWEIIGPLSEIGWRLRKHYYEVRNKSTGKDEYLASWTDYGPDKYLDDKDMHSIFKSLNQIQKIYGAHALSLNKNNNFANIATKRKEKFHNSLCETHICYLNDNWLLINFTLGNIKTVEIIGCIRFKCEKSNNQLIDVFQRNANHPYIYPIELSLCTDVGGLVVRTSHKNGSLRDLICGAKSRQSFLKKYGNPKGHKPLESTQISLYGRQILEALKFLHDKGFPYGHLHPGNVIIDNDRAKLLDIENGVLGVPSFYRPYFIQHKKINTIHAVDVYSFGHTLYEMTFGSPLHESVAESYPGSCPSLLKAVLDSILSPEACKSGLPTVESLLSNPFFSSISLTLLPTDRAHLKIPCSTKEHIKKCQTQLEDRLKEEQKTIRSQKRLVKVQELMSSEEEKKKQKQKLKHEQKQLRNQQKNKQEKSQKEKNGEISGDRSDSVNSTSTATSIGTATPPSVSGSRIPSPPSVPLPPPPPPPMQNGSSSQPPPTWDTSESKNRMALLGDICNFNKSNLRKTKA